MTHRWLNYCPKLFSVLRREIEWHDNFYATVECWYKEESFSSSIWRFVRWHQGIVYLDKMKCWNVFSPYWLGTKLLSHTTLFVYQNLSYEDLTSSSSPKSQGEVFHILYHLMLLKGDWAIIDMTAAKGILCTHWGCFSSPMTSMNLIQKQHPQRRVSHLQGFSS